MNPLDAAYQRGLTAFIAAVERVSETPESAADFRRALYLAFRHFGLKPIELTEHLKAGKGTVNKWVNEDVTPALELRQRALGWVLEGLRAQLRTGVMSVEDVLRKRVLAAC